MRSHAILCAVLGASLLLSACGSSGGGTTTTVLDPQFADPDLFLGTHAYFVIAGTQGGPEEVRTSWGDMNVQAGMLTSFGSSNNTGVVSGGVGSVGGNPYFVHGDRRFGTLSSLGQRIVATGGISADGSVAAEGGITPGYATGFSMFLRKGAGLDDSVLSGTYFFAAFGAQVAGVQTGSRWGRVQLDGAGAGTIAINSNIEGVIAPPGNLDLTYSVAANGELTWQFTGAQAMTGWCTGNGELAVLTGGLMAADDPLQIVMVREGAGFSDANLEGSWFLLGLSQAVGPNTYRSFTGSLVSNGMGVANVAGVSNEEGAITWTGEEMVGATLSGDGALTVTTGAETWSGGISESGRFGVLAGPTNAGTDPGMFILIR